jgi:hypothetical protein
MDAVVPMDALDCRSPTRCGVCEHWLGGACALEAQLALALAPRAPLLTLTTAPPLPAATS